MSEKVVFHSRKARTLPVGLAAVLFSLAVGAGGIYAGLTSSPGMLILGLAGLVAAAGIGRGVLQVKDGYRLAVDSAGLGVGVRGSVVEIPWSAVERIGFDPARHTIAVEPRAAYGRPRTRKPAPVWEARRGLFHLCRVDAMTAEPEQILDVLRRYGEGKWQERLTAS
ncbi:hypothetical protein HUT06_19630 [Actinomadura sp. NAK00032]|uniref:hypothetical protein n=1 Tax=Actinomadura sp. NAK00032 TaxID=2742128 RepID=UPI0015905D1C|nr:hypothetical protein [Actinomadura sp. NAK00032]QKW35975.1 hypothetical protein HUT06_19630 [Actinomadura sp. NAK00032]